MPHFEPINSCAVGYTGERQLSQGFLTKSFNHCLTEKLSGVYSWDVKPHSSPLLAFNALPLAPLSALKKVGTSRMSKQTKMLLELLQK